MRCPQLAAQLCALPGLQGATQLVLCCLHRNLSRPGGRAQCGMLAALLLSGGGRPAFQQCTVQCCRGVSGSAGALYNHARQGINSSSRARSCRQGMHNRTSRLLTVRAAQHGISAIRHRQHQLPACQVECALQQRASSSALLAELLTDAYNLSLRCLCPAACGHTRAVPVGRGAGCAQRTGPPTVGRAHSARRGSSVLHNAVGQAIWPAARKVPLLQAALRVQAPAWHGRAAGRACFIQPTRIPGLPHTAGSNMPSTAATALLPLTSIPTSSGHLGGCRSRSAAQPPSAADR